MQPVPQPVGRQPIIASDMSAIGQAAMVGNGAVTGQQLAPLSPIPSSMSALTTALLDSFGTSHAPLAPAVETALRLLPRIVAWVQEGEDIRAEMAKGVQG
jgi:hypothetical protein